MSYILDAIKKAEAERNIGAVPDIHAHPALHGLTEDRPPFWKNPVLWISLTAVLALALAVLLFRNFQGPGSAPRTAVVAVVPTPAPAPLPAPVSVAMAPTPVPQAEQPAPATDLPVQEEPVSNGANTAEETNADPVEPPMKRSARQREAASDFAAARHAPAPRTALAKTTPVELGNQPTSSKAAPAEVPAQNELPDAIQREIPPLVTGGYIYSANPANRSILVNGKLLHEGDQVTQDLKLEKLMQSGMILSFRGTRYRRGY